MLLVFEVDTRACAEWELRMDNNAVAVAAEESCS